METTREEVHFEELDELINKILVSYVVRSPSQSDDEWLMQTFSENLPEESAARVIELCTEVKENSALMNNFLSEARSSPKYEFKSQNWFYDKIKSSIKGGDFELFKNFHHQNAILDNVNRWSLEIGREFRDTAIHNSKDGEETNLNEEIGIHKKFSSSFIAPAVSIRKDAINSGIKKSVMTQYQKIMQLDMAHINFRTNDVTNIAMSLSKNAALTGVCGMMLTSSLSLLQRGTVGDKRSN